MHLRGGEYGPMSLCLLGLLNIGRTYLVRAEGVVHARFLWISLAGALWFMRPVPGSFLHIFFPCKGRWAGLQL